MIIMWFKFIIENLPNLHVNLHLIQHAKNYVTLLNISVGSRNKRNGTSSI